MCTDFRGFERPVFPLHTAFQSDTFYAQVSGYAAQAAGAPQNSTVKSDKPQKSVIFNYDGQICKKHLTLIIKAEYT